ncbi:hypothetical protein MHF_1224 [Mycoplasma haemofelis Ohio2]|uniref:Uncharacterized protein n=1 Tax=Mycoplasma haemofelis (strain Ohio2) TaxID=859194 RepID=F6FFP4_MYCHI|nr:hypothetical protein MHF_1224 [Mycoplasma haemofelis Ohio2]
MANSLLFKSLAGVGGIAAATGAAIGIPKLLEDKGELISELIKTKNPNKRLITSKSLEDADWKKAWESYRVANKDKSEDAWKLQGFDGQKNQEGQRAWDTFRTQCETNLKSKEISNSLLLSQVKDWCTK